MHLFHSTNKQFNNSLMESFGHQFPSTPLPKSKIFNPCPFGQAGLFLNPQFHTNTATVTSLFTFCIQNKYF
jgi:hypothetical protein